MTAPIVFTPMNKATSVESTDMPHVLGEPADPNWKGHAERSNDNFAAVNVFAQKVIAAVTPAAELSGTAVITLGTGWSLTNGWAFGRQLVFPGGRLIQLDMRLYYVGSTIYTTGTDSAWAPSNPAPGTIAAPFRPTAGIWCRTCAYWICQNTTHAENSTCDVNIADTGAMVLYRGSNNSGSMANPSRFDLCFTYIIL